MAQNITLLGNSYPDVPSVTLPKTGGGTASFTDVTDTTAAASDVAQGKYFYTSSGVKTEGTASGGGGGTKFLYEDTDGIGAWNVDGTTISYDYAPLKDGNIHLWFKVNSTVGYTVSTVIYCRANKVTIDWGDGNTQYAKGSSPYTDTHTYSTDGTYCVTISDPTNNRMRLRDLCVGQTSSQRNYTLVGAEVNASSNQAAQALNETFRFCNNLKRITTTVGDPGSYFADECPSLEHIDIGTSATSVSAYICGEAINLESFSGREGITTFYGYCFKGCHRLLDVSIPSTVTSIGSHCFSDCIRLLNIHVKPSTPPTIDTNTFGSGTSGYARIPSDCTIYVPSASLSAYQNATNWSYYASQMVGE